MIDSDKEASARGTRSPAFALCSLAALIGAGFLLRMHLLAMRAFWDDEAASVIFAQLPWRRFLETIWNYEANMTFYYLILRGWLHFGGSEVFIRGLSVLFGVAVIPAIYVLGKQLFGEKAGLAAALLSTLNIFQIRYSQEARSYSLVMLLSILSTYFLVKALDGPQNRRNWAAWVILSALGIYSHLFFYLVLAAQALAVMILCWRRCRRPALWSAVVLIFITAPIHWFLLTKEGGQLNWVPPPNFALLLEFAKVFTGYAGSLLLLITAALCGVAVFAAYRAPDGARAFSERQRVNLVTSWLVFPIAFTILFSFIEPVFFDRYMSISAPALSLLTGKGLVDIKKLVPSLRWGVPAMAVLLAGLCLWGIHKYDNSFEAQGDGWRDATQYVMAGVQPGDAAFFYRASGSRPFTFYSRLEMRGNRAKFLPVILFPADVNNALLFNVEPSAQQARQAVNDGFQRIWLVAQHWEQLQERRTALRTIQETLEQKNYHVVEQEAFPGESGPIHVFLYAKNPPKPPANGQQ